MCANGTETAPSQRCGESSYSPPRKDAVAVLSGTETGVYPFEYRLTAEHIACRQGGATVPTSLGTRADQRRFVPA